MLLDAFRSTGIYHHNILSASRGWLQQLIVRPQVILINFQASLYVSTLDGTYLRDAIIITELFTVVVTVIVFFINTIGNTFFRTSLRN